MTMVSDLFNRQVRYRFTFVLERLIVRGAHYRLLLVVAIIGIFSVVGGGLVMGVEGGFANPWEAFWWAFLRLSDPGYLGDDTGIFRRIVSTILTVAGYVMFMGALVATMSQWLNATLGRLELGLTPVRMQSHIAVLGWTDRTAELIRELILAQRHRQLARRFGRIWRRRPHALRIAVLADRVGPAMVAELREELGGSFRASQIVLRSGSALRVEHLDRVDVRHASAVVVPGADFMGTGVASQDARIMKVLLTVSAIARSSNVPPPTFVGELYDKRTVPAINDAYPGRVELVATEGLVGRMLASGIMQPGLTAVHQRLLTNADANTVLICDLHDLGGRTWFEAACAFDRGILLGRIQSEQGRDVVELNPPNDALVHPSDRLVLIAPVDESIDPEPPPAETTAPAPAPIELASPRVDRLLVLGWNRKAPAVLAELERHVPECQVCVVSPFSQERRLQDTAADGVTLVRLAVEHRVGDYIDPGLLDSLAPQTFDRVLLLSSEAMTNREEADARSIAAYLLLSETFEIHRCNPAILVELTDPDDAALLQRYPVQVLSSPRLVSHMLAKVILRRELHLVIDDLLGGGGADLRLVAARDYGLAGATPFSAIHRRVRAAGHTPLGLRLVTNGQVILNPRHDARFVLEPGDGIIVVA